MRPLRPSLDSITVLRRGPGHSGIPEVPSGSKYEHISPPRGLSISSEMESIVLGPTFPEQKGEATYTIPEECERLFCDSLSAIFLGERSDAGRESLGIDAGQIARNCVPHGRARVEKWFEVLDYTSDSIYRGFVTDMSGDRTLFVFFGDDTLGHGLKTGLIALFELAAIPNFDCARIVACVPRSQDASETEIVRNLGWCGFNLTTLQPWSTRASPLSTKWLFLDAEV